MRCVQVVALCVLVCGVCAWECGSGVTCEISGSTLTVKGNGKMNDYDVGKAPWISSSFETLVIENGVTYIGRHAFNGCPQLKTVSIPASVTSIGDYSFSLPSFGILHC